MNYSKLKKLIKKLLGKNEFQQESLETIITNFKTAGSIPWSYGYNEYKWHKINESLNNSELLGQFSRNIIPTNYGIALDERIIEYPWIFSRITKDSSIFLDAGSTFNFESIINHPSLIGKEKFIYTFYPEENNFAKNRISYIYGDLRRLPFRDSFFDFVVCQSTLEHIDMDNSIYGYQNEADQLKPTSKSYNYLEVIKELVRVTTVGGKLLITFPYGVYEHHGFFQQFDEEMVERIDLILKDHCKSLKSFILYKKNGWEFASQSDCNEAISYNPHSGRGKSDDNAAHCRAICLIEIEKQMSFK